jgi:predicted DNA-binding transcriptional regulator AlpA
MTLEPLWDAKDVAVFLKVSRSWVYLKTNSGELPHRRMGGLIRYEPEVMRQFARGEIKPSARVVSMLRGP